MKIYKSLLTEIQCTSIIDNLENNFEWNLVPAALKIYYNVKIPRKNFPELIEVYDKIVSRPPWNDNIWFNKLKAGNYVEKHIDKSRYGFLIMLKNADVGGTFYIKDKKIDLAAGDGLIFNSYVEHYTTMVHEGERISSIVWFD